MLLSDCATRRAVRNHLKSIHAIALANLGEFTTGLSLISLLDNKSNAILTKIEVVYLKKARGTLVSESNIVIPSLTPGDTEFCVTANIKNEAGEFGLPGVSDLAGESCAELIIMRMQTILVM